MPPSPAPSDAEPLSRPTVALTVDELAAALTVIQGHTQMLRRDVRKEIAPNRAQLSRRAECIEDAVANAVKCLHALEPDAR